MDLEILSAGAAKGLVESLEATFTAETGIGIHGHFNAVGAIHERALAGDACDVIILTAAMIAELARVGRVFPETVAPLGRVRTAIAVRERDALPDISSREALRTLLLASDEIYVPDVERSTAGIHFVKVLRALGIYEAVAPRLRSFPSGAIAMRALAQSTLSTPSAAPRSPRSSTRRASRWPDRCRRNSSSRPPIRPACLPMRVNRRRRAALSAC